MDLICTFNSGNLVRYASRGDAVVANTDVLTPLASLNYPVEADQAGGFADQVQFYIAGTVSTKAAAPGDLTFSVAIGPDAKLDFTLTPDGGLVDIPFILTATAVVNERGEAGLVSMSGAIGSPEDTLRDLLVPTADQDLNTVATSIATASAQWETADVDNSLTFRQMIVEFTRSPQSVAA